VLGFVTTLLSLRLEQVIVKKIAAGENASGLLTLFSGHIFLSGIFFYLVLLAGNALFPSFFTAHNLLLVLSVSQLLSFFSLPFKQVAAGKQHFGWLAVMSSVANIVRTIWLLWVVLFSMLDIQQVLIIYIVSAFAELLVSVYLSVSRMGTAIRPGKSLRPYLALVSESMPQIGMVFLNACMARIDWILLGFFSTQVITAEYSFAYKVFELSPVPLLIIGPLLLSKFSAYFSMYPKESLRHYRSELHLLIRMEMIMAGFFPMVLNLVWAPLIDALTDHKYGEVNSTSFLLLSLCIPFQYMINLFWSIHFSLSHLAMIFRITAIACLVIIVGDILLIPVLSAQGAALVYLLAMVLEYVLYLVNSSFMDKTDCIIPLLICTSTALASGLAVYFLDMPLMLKLSIAVALYGILLSLTGQIRRTDWSMIRNRIWQQETDKTAVR
jgi:O-antigen/teichoic acid export membrane protein